MRIKEKAKIIFSLDITNPIRISTIIRFLNNNSLKNKNIPNLKSIKLRKIKLRNKIIFMIFIKVTIKKKKMIKKL